MSLIKAAIIAVILSTLSATIAKGQDNKIDSLETLLKKHVQIDTAKVNLLNTLAYEIRINNPSKAKSHAIQAGELSAQLDYPKGKATSLWIIGITTLNSDKQGALDMFRTALTIADKAGDEAGRCNYLIAIGNGERRLGNTTASNKAYRQALQTARKIGDKRLIIKTQFNISGNLIRSGEHIEASRLLQEVITLSEEIHYEEMVARAYASLGVIYNVRGDYPTSLEYYLSALTRNEARHDYVGIQDCLNTIAGIQSNHNDFDQALETANKALQLSIQKQDSMRLSACYNLLGNIYRRMNRPEALAYYQKSLSLSKFNKIPININNLQAIGSIYTEQGEFDKAMSCLDQALIQARKAGLKRASGEVYVNIGVTYFEQKKYGPAKDNIRKALLLAKETAAVSIQQECHRLLSEIHAATGNFQEAYTDQLQYKLLSDSLFNEKNTKKIALLESSYKFDKERVAYEMEKSHRELKIKNQRQTILYLIVISMLVVLLAFAIYWSGKLKKRVLTLKIESINKELEANQKNMAVAKLKLIQNSERDLHNVKMLEDIGKNSAGVGHKNLSALINNYKTQHHHSNWEEFEMLFTKINTSFWEKLNELNPNLTPNERKLCAFLKLNMNNKEIMLITFQSEDALKKSRLRLRKKLNLDRNTNLTAFIHNL